MTVAEAAERFFVALEADGVKPQSVRWYRHRLARFLRTFGHRDVKTVTLDDVRGYVVSVRALQYADYTLFSLVRVVRRLFKWLYEERQIDDGFYKRIKAPRLPQLPPKAVDLEHVRAMLSACGNSPAGKRDKAIVLFLLDTGCRVGGLCGLNVGDLDLVGGRARVLEKGDRSRTILFGEMTSKALRAWLRGRPFPDAEFVFTSLRERRRMTGFTVIQILRRLAKRAGVVGRVNPHAFRHTFAREFILNGGDIGTLSQILGHSQILVTKQFYAMFTVDELKGEHERYSPVSRLNGGSAARRRG